MEDDKNCQVNMWSVIPAMCGDDKKCQFTQFYKNPVCGDYKNCQSTQYNYMWSAKPKMDMQSVEPATYKNLCGDKNCQSTRCYKKKSLVTPVCNDKNCQSAKTLY